SPGAGESDSDGSLPRSISLAGPTSRTSTSNPIPRRPTMSSLAATTTTATTTPTSLKDRLLKIGLEAIARILEDFLARVTKSRMSPVQMLEEIVRLEEIDQSRRSLESRLRRARIGRFKPMADFDWNWPKKIERDLIERAFTLDFIREGRNLALIGTNGLGKTMIARNIAHQAALAGFSVVCTT